MKTINSLILASFIALPFWMFSQKIVSTQEGHQLLSKTSKNFFIENKGQWPKEVRFLAQIGGMNAWITNSGVTYDYYQLSTDQKSTKIQDPIQPKNRGFNEEKISKKGQVVDMLLEGANTEAKALPSGLQEGYHNYIIGNDPNQWASFVKLYNEVLIQDIYPGINIHYYFDNGLIRYDYIIKPGADLSQIKLKINGSDGYSINEAGELSLKTCIGNITHGKLYAYQQEGNNKTEVSCSFAKMQNGSIGVAAQNYNSGLALVIDPLVYSSFISGSLYDWAYSIAIDGGGSAYVCGYTTSTDYPTTIGAYDGSFNGSTTMDAFVTKLNPTGSALVYSTFIGGTTNDIAYSLGVDAGGNSFITGYTTSTDYPTSSGAYDVSQNGSMDAFVTKLNPAGSALVYSTFVGGGSDDAAYALKLDGNGNAFITGYTNSAAYPSTAGAYNVTKNSSGDVFVTKLNTTGTSLVYSTFIGGSGDEMVQSITIDASGNSYITGFTTSSNYPATTGAFDQSFNSGVFDVFVTKLNSTGTALVYSTFLGGSADDRSYAIAVDGIGNAFITGYTLSTDYPTTVGAFNTMMNSSTDAFVTKLNPSGSALIYSTFIGGTSDDQGFAIALDINGNAVIAGFGSYWDFPKTLGTSENGSGFLTKLNTNGSALIYSSHIGGSGGYNSICQSLAIDASGNIFICGKTNSPNFPTTNGAYDRSYSGGLYDAFVTKILPINQAVKIIISNLTSINATCKWTKGDGIKRAVFVKQATLGVALPANNTTYNANNVFGMGKQIGTTGWYCVYNDTGSVVTINGLNPNTTYTAMVCEYTGTAGNEFYNSDSVNNNPAAFTTNYPTPSTQASNLSFNYISPISFSVSCTKGDGTKRAFFIRTGSFGKALPIMKTTYAPNSAYILGAQIGTTGWYCVYNDTGRTVSISNLLPNTTYRIMVCEYNGPSGKEQYNTDSVVGNPNSQITDYPMPNTQAYNIVLSGTSTSSFDASWTNGDGTGRVVFVKEGNAGNAIPAKYNTYIANGSFGSGGQIGSSGWFCVYNGTGSSVSVSGLVPNTVYRIMVCEYYGTPGREYFNRNAAVNNPVNSDPIPDIQAKSISFSNLTPNSLTSTWVNGNGLSRAVFICANNSGNATPANNTTYTANKKFGLGSQIASTGWYCVYNGTGNTVNLANLATNTSYRLMVCEYNGAANSEQYNSNVELLNPSNVKTRMDTQSICLVTVDTITWKNKILWEKNKNAKTASYTIYKEVSSDVYDSIGNVAYSQPSQFIDLISQPESNGEKYKIVAVDSSNNISNRSFYHQTMNLTISAAGSTMGLRWDPYKDESGKFIPSNYYIYRGSSPTDMQLVKTVSGSIVSWNDVNVFSVYYYLVGVTKADGCDLNRGGGPVMSFSNKKDNKSLLGIGKHYKNSSVIIYPNPFSQFTTISFPNINKKTYNLRIFDLSGKIVRTIPNISDHKVIVSKADLSAGLYYFELVGDECFRGKFVVE